MKDLHGIRWMSLDGLLSRVNASSGYVPGGSLHFMEG